MINGSYHRILNSPTFSVDENLYPHVDRARRLDELCGMNASEFRPSS